jgi:uncharacterized beta-barrel protein YwiB (DUF1934 family)
MYHAFSHAPMELHSWQWKAHVIYSGETAKVDMRTHLLIADQIKEVYLIRIMIQSRNQ